MRVSYEGYAQLLRRMSETAHQSCLLLTSREKPTDLVSLEGHRSPVRTVRLAGLDSRAGAQVLAEKEVADSPHDRGHLVEVYRGNPLALKIVAQTIVELFGGEIAPFLEQGEVVFGGVRKLLDEQFARLSVLEQRVFYWLAILREPVSLEELLAVLATPRTPMQVLEVLDSLRSRSLIEIGQRPGSFTLHSVVLEYATARLITEASREIEQGRLVHLIEHGLCRAHVKEYVREIQERLLLGPVLTELQRTYQGQADLGARLLWLLDWLRDQDQKSQGYGPANVVMLLRVLQGDLRGLDLSRLVIRGASLQGVEMQGAKLSGALLHETVFTETFDTSWSVAISRNGQYWAAGSTRGEVRVWRERGKVLHLAWQGHNDTVRALAFSPDGAIKLWDIESGALLWTSWHTNNIQRIAFAPDGGTLASSGGDATIRLWEVESLRCLQTLAGHTDRVHSVGWSPDGRTLASCGLDQTIWLWDAQQGSYRTVLHGHTAGVYDLAFTPDSRNLLSGSDDGTLRLWDVERGQCVHIMQGYAVSLYDVAWRPDGIQLASAGSDRLVTLWDVEGLTPPRVLHGHSWIPHGVAWSPDGQLLASSGEDNTVRVWNATTGASVQLLRDPDHAETVFYGVAWSPDGKFLASTSYQRGVQVWEVITSTRRWVGQAQPTRIRRVAWSPEGMQLVSGGDDGSVCLWKASDGTLLQRFQGHRGLVMSVAWSPDGKRLASGGGDRVGGEIVIWEVRSGVRSGERLHIWSEPSAIVNAVTWSPTGAVLVTGHSDGTLHWWNVQSRECVQVRQGHQGVVQALRVNPEGQKLASCGDDGTIKLWNLQSAEQLRTLRRDRPYERLEITGIRGLSTAQKASLLALGAFEETSIDG